MRPVRGAGSTGLASLPAAVRSVFYKLYSTTEPSSGGGFCRSLHRPGVNFILCPTCLAFGKIQVKLLSALLLYVSLDFVEDTSPQQNCNKLLLFSAYTTLASAKILPPQQIQVNLLLPSLIGILCPMKISKKTSRRKPVLHVVWAAIFLVAEYYTFELMSELHINFNNVVYILGKIAPISWFLADTTGAGTAAAAANQRVWYIADHLLVCWRSGDIRRNTGVELTLWRR